jgi:hypothetical protein
MRLIVHLRRLFYYMVQLLLPIKITGKNPINIILRNFDFSLYIWTINILRFFAFNGPIILMHADYLNG